MAQIESVDDLIARGNALFDQKRYAAALPFFERATQRDLGPRSFVSWVFLGYTSLVLEHWQEALAASDRALDIAPNNAMAWYLKGAAMGKLNRWREALAAYDRALELDPNDNDAVAWSSKGVALARLKRFREALAACERALELDSNHVLAWVLKGAMLRKLWR